MVKNSCGLSVIEFQEAAEALASLYIPRYFTDPILGRWKQDHVALALVISLRVEVIHVILKAVAERACSEKNYFRQELVLYGSNPAFAMGVQIWTPRGQCHRFDTDGVEDPVERCAEFCIAIV